MSNIQNFSKEVAKALAECSQEVNEGLETAKLESAKNIVKSLKVSSPKQTGGYAKGWRVSKIGTAQVIHNKTDYQLTHLLEYGHAKVGGGRVAAKAHIRPAEEAAIAEFTKAVEKVVKG